MKCLEVKEEQEISGEVRTSVNLYLLESRVATILVSVSILSICMSTSANAPMRCLTPYLGSLSDDQCGSYKHRSPLKPLLSLPQLSGRLALTTGPTAAPITPGCPPAFSLALSQSVSASGSPSVLPRLLLRTLPPRSFRMKSRGRSW